MFCNISKSGCDIGFYGESCTKCPDNCLSDICHFQIGLCFDCKEGFKGEMCEGTKMCGNLSHVQRNTQVSFFLACLKAGIFVLSFEDICHRIRNLYYVHLFEGSIIININCFKSAPRTWKSMFLSVWKLSKRVAM